MSSLPQEIIDILIQFESAWDQGTPDLTEFLPADQTQRLAVLVELIPIDLRRCQT
jgi:hypothetical protein